MIIQDQIQISESQLQPTTQTGISDLLHFYCINATYISHLNKIPPSKIHLKQLQTD